MSKVAEACRLNSAIGASIGGIHMEGPYLSPDDGPRGAHPVAHIRQPSIAEFELLQEAAEGRISVVTLAPEIAGAMNFIRYLADQGTIVSIGHSGASPAQIREAADHGASMSTHLGNGSHLLLPRHSNYVWEQLADDRLSAGLIADGHHLPPSVLKTMLRAKREKAFVVSDCVSFAGMPTGDYTSQIGDKVVLDDRGRISMKHNPEILAGSAATLDMQMNLLLNDMSMPINEAISLITKRPAETMGWAQYGKLVSGTIGNLTLFDFHKDVAKVKIVETVVRGNSVYSA
jgi:N-acetylglucosamine-6-phosphate deacetylase